MSRIAGTKGTLWMDGSVVKVADRDGVRELPVPPNLVLPTPPTSDSSKPALFGLPPFIRLCEAFRARIDGKSSHHAVPLPTFADGLACMQVLDAIRASAADQGALVKLTAD
jgi:predicted dehydrogenase